MAHTPSSKKRIRQNATRRARNRRRKDQVKQTVRAVEEAIRQGDAAKAGEQLNLCYKKLDQVAAKGTIHKNRAARKKAGLARQVARMSAGGST